METLRTFIALDMPPAIKAAVETYVQPLKMLPGRVSWVKAENLHLTLKFLGETPADRVEDIAATLHDIAATVPPFTVDIADCGAFPHDRAPRVLWVGFQDTSGVVRQLAQALDERLQRYGFAREQHAFRPHVTIGRVKEARIPDILRRLKAQPFTAMPASFQAMTFMRSALHPAGAIYTPLHICKLGQPGLQEPPTLT